MVGAGVARLRVIENPLLPLISIYIWLSPTLQLATEQGEIWNPLDILPNIRGGYLVDYRLSAVSG